MFGRVQFSSLKKSNTLVVPRESLIGSIKDSKVFVVNGETAELRNVVIGNTYNNYLEILSGINEGEQVVISGQNNLQDKDKVIVKN